MKTYALIETGTVREVILPARYEADPEIADAVLPDLIGQEIPITARFSPELVAQMVDISDATPQPAYGWVYQDGVFAEPAPVQQTAEEILAFNTATRDSLLSQAGLAMAPLQDAVDLGVATAEEVALLTQWKQYRVGLNRTDLAVVSPDWPLQP